MSKSAEQKAPVPEKSSSATTSNTEKPPVTLSRIEQLAANNSKDVNKKYLQRIGLVKRGREAFSKNDFKGAISYYNQYLKVLSSFFNTGIQDITPKLFHKEQDISETLMLSQVYWDLARIYSYSPKLKREFLNALDNFVIFSSGYKYQVANSEMLRKFIKSNSNHPHIKDFQQAYQRIYIVSKKCYVATHCFGETHVVTNDLRELKLLLIESRQGQKFVDIYYYLSPLLIKTLKKSYILDFILTKLLFTPTLTLFAKFARKHILK